MNNQPITSTPYRLSRKWLKKEMQKNYEISQLLFNCGHQLSVCKKTSINNKLVYQLVCNICGKFFAAIKKQDAVNEFDYEELPERDEELRSKFLERVNKHLKELNDKTYQIFNASWDHNNNRNYHEYLNSEEWNKKRQLILDRCKHICESCGLEKATQVHHLTYDNIFNEHLFELIGVCLSCHKKIHDIEEEDAVLIGVDNV